MTIALYKTKHLGRLNLRPWRLNLITSFKDRLYVAVHNVIFVYDLDCQLVDQIKVITASELGHTTSGGTDEFGTTINQIISGYCGKLETVAIVLDDGGVCIYDIHSLKKPLYYFNSVSTWGIDIHKNGLLAVSCNDKKIKVWKVASAFDQNDPQTWLEELQVRYGSYKEPLITEASLLGHSHNIPSISFSTCGKFITSASIDKTCRVWSIEHNACIAIHITSHQWGWISKCFSTSYCNLVDQSELEDSITQDISTSVPTYPALNRSTQQYYENSSVEIDGALVQVQQIFEDSSSSLSNTDSIHSNPTPSTSPQSPLPPSISSEFTDLIIHCTKYDLMLYKLVPIYDSGSILSTRFETLYSCSNIVRTLPNRRQVALLEHFDRLCLMQCIPEQGVIVLASQQSSGCFMQLNKSKNKNKYYLKTIKLFDDAAPESPLAGISILSHIHPKYASLSYYLIYTLYLDGTLLIYRMNPF